MDIFWPCDPDFLKLYEKFLCVCLCDFSGEQVHNFFEILKEFLTHIDVEDLFSNVND